MPSKVTCSLCKQSGHNKRTCPINDINIKKVSNEMPKVDLYTADALRDFLYAEKEHITKLFSISKKYNITFRKPNFPENISENIIKFIIHKSGDKTSTWNCGGDLLSKIEGKQECKCFTSNGPISFTPSSKWNCIYFLDARSWLENHYILYRVPLTIDSEEWKNIKVNKNQTFEDQTKQGRRPRIGWDSLHPQIEPYCHKVYEGTFENIFIEEMA